MSEPASRATLAIRTLVFTALVPGAIAIGMPWLILLSPLGELRVRPGPFAFAGVLAFTLGVVLYASAAREFVDAGEGTPLPVSPPRRLVTTGPYGRMRNPIYAAVVLAVFGESLYFGAPSLFAFSLFLAGILHVRVVALEEPRLGKRFGTDYDRYRSNVPRWIPRLRPAQESGLS